MTSEVSTNSSDKRASPRPAIEAFGLTKDYRLGEYRSLSLTISRMIGRSGNAGLFEALSAVDLRVRTGESVGIVGGNGSGKSTLLQLIAGITIPSGGSLVVRGRVLPLLAIGTGFHQELTGRENVMLFGASIGIQRGVIQDRMDEVAAFAELERHMDTPVKRFSSGMLSRLSFATAVLFPADVYLFDEVLAVVDGEFQERCLAEIAGLHRAGRTVLFVSHNLAQVASICSEVVWLESGRVRQHGPADEVLKTYETSAVERGPV
jgi:ABC-type polysaccharide/polyol phosphate transport system ATPase subunit